MTTPEEALKLTMDKFDLSGADISRLSGIARTQISSFSTNNRSISTKNFIKIAQTLPPEARTYYLNLVLGIAYTAPTYSNTAQIQRLQHRAAELGASYQALNQDIAALQTMYQPPQTPFAAFIHHWLQENKVTLEEFRLLIQQRSDLAPTSLEEILSGTRNPTETELGYLGTSLTQPSGEPFDLGELKAIASGKVSPHKDHSEHNRIH